jgi:hypothetical protein
MASDELISDEEIAALPEDRQSAFVEFEKIVRARVQARENEVAGQQWGDADPYRLEYINKVLAAARAYEVEALKDWQVPPTGSSNIFDEYRQFTADVDHFTMQIRIRKAPINRRSSVGLDGNTKVKIHHHIEQIRQTIDAAGLPVEKHDALCAKLNRFALEVDKIRTDLRTGMAFYIAVCAGIGEGFKKLEPARRFIDSIATLMGKAKEFEENLPELPQAAERKQLEPPRKVLPPPVRDLDDEIPF